MQYVSKNPIKTLKSVPNVSDNVSTGLLIQGGFIRQELAGAYHFLPLGLKVLRNIENIVREEMDAIGAHELLMPALCRKESWDKTDRWDNVDVLFKLDGHGNTKYALSPTHEESVTPLIKEFVQSYKDLDFGVYQIQDKFRNEARAKSGILRGREFWMKDLYSFHKTEESMQEYYEMVAQAYKKIFDRLGIGDITKVATADGGAFTDKYSHEFQTLLPIGEDIICFDESGYCANLEVAEGQSDDKNSDEAELKMEKIDAPDVRTIDAMVEFFGKPNWQMIKTVVYKKSDGTFFGISVRGDLEVNELKVGRILGRDFEQASEEDLINLGTARGYVSPIKEDNYDITFYGDNSLKTVKNFIGGGKQDGVDRININLGDMDIKEFGDFTEAKEGFMSPNGEKLRFEKASEVGNIFRLYTKFSDAFGLSYTDEKGKNNEVLMGCYGIGISRVMGVIAEAMMDENGLVWPENIAPYTHYIMVIGDNLEKAEQLARDLEKKGARVLIDDRDKKVGFGQKARDADLLGIPYRIVVSPKTLEANSYELKARNSQETELISF
ncbi:MAG: proline--tRNA ligase [Candidatus Gracilibacteria bacterium]|nr:proline--tRNA ligase [Candidatus Gracilibacteria bacterium]